MEHDQRAVVAVFDDRLAAERAVDALYSAGFDSQQVGFAIRGADDVQGGMIHDATSTKDGNGAAAGALTGGVVGGVLATAVAILIPPAAPVLVGGLLAAFFGGTLAGTAVGGIFGAMMGLGVSEQEAKHFDNAFKQGRAIVAVRADGRAGEAADILTRHGGQDVHSEATSPVPTEGLFNAPLL